MRFGLQSRNELDQGSGGLSAMRLVLSLGGPAGREVQRLRARG